MTNPMDRERPHLRIMRGEAQSDESRALRHLHAIHSGMTQDQLRRQFRADIARMLPGALAFLASIFVLILGEQAGARGTGGDGKVADLSEARAMEHVPAAYRGLTVLQLRSQLRYEVGIMGPRELVSLSQALGGLAQALGGLAHIGLPGRSA